MSPGVNDQQCSKGALPKSNRRSINRSHDRVSVPDNQDSNWNGRTQYFGRSSPQFSKNLFSEYELSERLLQSQQQQLQQQQQNKCKANSLTKNSKPSQAVELSPVCNTTYNTSSSLKDTHVPGLQSRWSKVLKSPSSKKRTNMVKIMDSTQIEQRIKEIRENIGKTKYMIDLFSGSSDPHVQKQRETLIKMVDDLSNTEYTLKKFLRESYDLAASQNGECSENGVSVREAELNKKVTESQRKLAILLQQQAELTKMTSILDDKSPLSDNEEVEGNEDEHNEASSQLLVEQLQEENNGKIEKLDSDAGVIMNKLEELEHKKERIDHLLQELQAVQLLEFNSEGSNLATISDKVAELDARRAQLAHIKNLLKGTTYDDSDNEITTTDQAQYQEEATPVEVCYNDNTIQEPEQNENINDAEPNKALTLEQIQAITKEMKAHQQLLLEARSSLSTMKAARRPMELSTSQKKFGNSDRKPQCISPTISQCATENRDYRKMSTTQPSNRGTPDVCASPCSHATIQGTSVTNVANDNVLNVLPQPSSQCYPDPNFWMMSANIGMPPAMPNPIPQGPFWPQAMHNHPQQNLTGSSAEYYKQLLINSQNQHLQTMSTTMHQCYHLLWTQQREMQTMKSTIAQLQAQVRNLEARVNPEQSHEESHSNLNRSQQQHYGTLDASTATLPPSASLPNLVTLPGIPPLSPQAPVQPPQLNNQVPPGNRANNYWDNFRSYSRQNLLSGNSNKPMTEYATSSSSHGPPSTNTATSLGANIVSQNNKYNHSDNQSETHYSLNLQDNQPVPGDVAGVADTYDTETADVIPGVRSNEYLIRIKKKIKKVTVDDLRQILIQFVEQQETEQSIQTNKATIPSSNLSSSSKWSDESETCFCSRIGEASNYPLPTLDHIESNSLMHSLDIPTIDNAEANSILISSSTANNNRQENRAEASNQPILQSFVSSTSDNFVLVEPSSTLLETREVPDEILVLNDEEHTSGIDQ